MKISLWLLIWNMNTIRNECSITWSGHPLAWKPAEEAHHWWSLAWHIQALPPILSLNFPALSFIVALVILPPLRPRQSCCLAESNVTSSIQASLMPFLLPQTTLVSCPILYLENMKYSFKTQYNYYPLWKVASKFLSHQKWGCNTL